MPDVAVMPRRPSKVAGASEEKEILASFAQDRKLRVPASSRSFAVGAEPRSLLAAAGVARRERLTLGRGSAEQQQLLLAGAALTHAGMRFEAGQPCIAADSLPCGSGCMVVRVGTSGRCSSPCHLRQVTTSGLLDAQPLRCCAVLLLLTLNQQAQRFMQQLLLCPAARQVPLMLCAARTPRGADGGAHCCVCDAPYRAGGEGLDKLRREADGKLVARRSAMCAKHRCKHPRVKCGTPSLCVQPFFCACRLSRLHDSVATCHCMLYHHHTHEHRLLQTSCNNEQGPAVFKQLHDAQTQHRGRGLSILEFHASLHL